MERVKIPIASQHMTEVNLFQAYCVVTGLWGLNVCPAGEDFRERVKSCPLFDVDFGDLSKGTPGHMQGLTEGNYFFFYASEEEMRRAYSFVVGDDGPTENNPYNGPAKTYAVTCDPHGQLLTCNT